MLRQRQAARERTCTEVLSPKHLAKSHRQGMTAPSDNARDGEPVVAFRTDSLQGCGAEARFFCEQLEKLPSSLNVFVLARGIDHRAVAYHIIDDDERARMRNFERPT